MQQAVSARTPAHLWIVGILALLWNCFGAYDYVMSNMRNADYIKSAMPGVDPAAALAWMDAFPIYAKIGWALGVWGGVLGSILLLMRSRYAVWAFVLSVIGIVLSIGYQLFVATPLSGANSPMAKIIPAVITVVGLFLLWYSWKAEKKGVLR
jgi:hypothetical protein